jgi:bacteriocin-like protein
MNMSNEIRELSINELDSVSGGSDRIGGAAGPVSQPTGPVGPRDPQPSYAKERQLRPSDDPFLGLWIWVLACFNDQWPDLILTVACFEA